VKAFYRRLDELLKAQARLLDDGSEGFALEAAIVIGNGDAGYWTIRVLEDVMGAGAVVNEKSGSF